jgi:hypothetical protein
MGPRVRAGPGAGGAVHGRPAEGGGRRGKGGRCAEVCIVYATRAICVWLCVQGSVADSACGGVHAAVAVSVWLCAARCISQLLCAH